MQSHDWSNEGQGQGSTAQAQRTRRAFEQERSPLAQRQGGSAQVAAPGGRLNQVAARRGAGVQACRASTRRQQDASDGHEPLRRRQHACRMSNTGHMLAGGHHKAGFNVVGRSVPRRPVPLTDSKIQPGSTAPCGMGCVSSADPSNASVSIASSGWSASPAPGASHMAACSTAMASSSRRQRSAADRLCSGVSTLCRNRSLAASLCGQQKAQDAVVTA